MAHPLFTIPPTVQMYMLLLVVVAARRKQLAATRASQAGPRIPARRVSDPAAEAAARVQAAQLEYPLILVAREVLAYFKLGEMGFNVEVLVEQLLRFHLDGHQVALATGVQVRWAAEVAVAITAVAVDRVLLGTRWH